MSNAAIWNKDYAMGSWNSLRSVRAVAHRAVMAGLAEHFGQDNDVLDVGCGEGLLSKYVAEGCFYTGLDISDVALKTAMAGFRGCFRKFLLADFETWEPPSDIRFSCVFFGESIYYFDDPGKQLNRVKPWLRDDGIVIISSLAEIPLEGWDVLVQFKMTCTTDYGTWKVTCLRPKT